MALKQRDPDDPIQTLRTKHHGEVRVDGMSFMDGPGVGIHVVKVPGGGYRHARGGAIKSEKELRTAIPKGPELDKALEWWANKDNWQETAPRQIIFEAGTGYPIFEDTREYVESDEDLQQFWPSGPVLFAAIRALGKRKEGGEKPVTYARATGSAPAPRKAEAKPPVAKRDTSKAVAASLAARQAKAAAQREVMSNQPEAAAAGE